MSIKVGYSGNIMRLSGTIVMDPTRTVSIKTGISDTRFVILSAQMHTLVEEGFLTEEQSDTITKLLKSNDEESIELGDKLIQTKEEERRNKQSVIRKVCRLMKF